MDNAFSNEKCTLNSFSKITNKSWKLSFLYVINAKSCVFPASKWSHLSWFYWTYFDKLMCKPCMCHTMNTFHWNPSVIALETESNECIVTCGIVCMVRSFSCSPIYLQSYSVSSLLLQWATSYLAAIALI